MDLEREKTELYIQEEQEAGMLEKYEGNEAPLNVPGTGGMILELNEEVTKAIDLCEIFLKVWSVLQMIYAGVMVLMVVTIPLAVPSIMAHMNTFKASASLEKLKYKRDEEVIKEYFRFMGKAVKMIYIYIAVYAVSVVIGIAFITILIMSGYFDSM